MSDPRNEIADALREAMPDLPDLAEFTIANAITGAVERIAFGALRQALALVPLEVQATQAEALAARLRTWGGSDGADTFHACSPEHAASVVAEQEDDFDVEIEAKGKDMRRLLPDGARHTAIEEWAKRARDEIHEAHESLAGVWDIARGVPDQDALVAVRKRLTALLDRWPG